MQQTRLLYTLMTALEEEGLVVFADPNESRIMSRSQMWWLNQMSILQDTCCLRKLASTKVRLQPHSCCMELQSGDKSRLHGGVGGCVGAYYKETLTYVIAMLRDRQNSW